MSYTTLGGTYSSVNDFRAATMGRLGKIMDKSAPLHIRVINIIGGGTGENWATVEMEGTARCKNGMDYNQRYVWCTRWDGDGDNAKIVQVRAYLDTSLVDRVIESNEQGSGAEQ
jgi:uncharacterized protein